MARRIVIEFLGKDSTDKTAAAVEKRFGRLGGKLDQIGQRSGKVLAGGFALAGVAALKLGDKASDLAETQSKVAQIFGQESTAALDKFAGAAARTMGQSKQSALDAAATFGIFGKSAGLSGKELVGFSTNLTGLASDMASFSNTSPEEAIEAIGSALRGEAEPIRKYGVLLDDATLRNEALKLGLIKTTKQALTPQQRVLAAQAAIMKQTSDQQGDFARTSGGLANKQRILRAQMDNLGVSVGSKVVPAMLKMTEVGGDITNWIERNKTTTGVLVAVLGILGATLWATSVAMRAMTTYTAFQEAMAKRAAAGQWTLNAAFLANPVVLITAGIIAFGAALVLAYKKSETFRNIVNGAFSAVKGAAISAFNWVKSHWPLLLAILTGPIGLAVLAIAKNWSRIKAGAKGAVDFVRDKFDALVSWCRKLPGRMKGAFSGMFDGVRNAFKSALNFVIRGWNRLDFHFGGKKLKGLPDIPSFTIGTPNIPELAEGGVVRARRGGILARIGEGNYDEAVVPLDGPNAPRGLGSTIIQIIVNGALDPEAVARQIEQLLTRRRRLLGRPLEFV